MLTLGVHGRAASKREGDRVSSEYRILWSLPGVERLEAEGRIQGTTGTELGPGLWEKEGDEAER